MFVIKKRAQDCKIFSRTGDTYSSPVSRHVCFYFVDWIGQDPEQPDAQLCGQLAHAEEELIHVDGAGGVEIDGVEDRLEILHAHFLSLYILERKTNMF